MSILVGIHRAIHEKEDPDLSVYIKILEHNKVPYIMLDSSHADFWDKLNNVTHFIYRWTHSHHDHIIAGAILPVIQYQLKIKCFPTWETSWHYDDKIKQYYLLKSKNYPVCDSYIFYHLDQALEFIENTDYPLVHKIRHGAGAMNVTLIKSKNEARRMVKKAFGKGISQANISLLKICKTLNYNLKKILRGIAITTRDNYFKRHQLRLWFRHKNYVYFQKFMPNNDFDVRVTTAGNRVHAFIRYNREGDFRASGGNKWDIKPESIDKRMLEMALDITNEFGFQAMAYDFLYDENKNPCLIEMSYLYGGAGYPDFMNGYWDENLNRVEGRFWPQHFELIDFLDNPSLACPDNLDLDSDYKKYSS